uniref:UNC-50 family protein n=1 Tax=Solanum tuberosum TaxID=4113 RepID=M1CFQ6_SOLTU
MLPTTSKGLGRTSSHVRPNSVLPQYLRKIIKISAHKVPQAKLMHKSSQGPYKSSAPSCSYLLETKNQWARDDPAFIVICTLLLVIATLAYCAAYDHSAGHAVFVVISVLLFHFILTGATLATCCWFLTNNYLREEAPSSHAVEQRVEWLYAFDVHCNSFFPMFVLLYVIHYFLSPLLVAHGFIPVLLSNLLFMVAASYYHYLNFLGYDGKMNTIS